MQVKMPTRHYALECPPEWDDPDVFPMICEYHLVEVTDEARLAFDWPDDLTYAVYVPEDDEWLTSTDALDLIFCVAPIAIFRGANEMVVTLP